MKEARQRGDGYKVAGLTAQGLGKWLGSKVTGWPGSLDLVGMWQGRKVAGWWGWLECERAIGEGAR